MRRLLLAVLIGSSAAVIGLLTSADGAQSTAGSFGPPQALGVAEPTSVAATGDFDADGRPDLVAAAPGAGKVAVHLGTGTGFASSTSVEVPGAVDVAVTDLDADGHDDALVAGAAGVTLLRGNGSGAFTAVSAALGAAPTGIASGDIDLDGDEDVLAALGTGGVRVVRNDAGALVPAATVAGAALRILLADVNGDLLPDLVTGGGTEVRVRPGDGTGGFGAPVAATVSDAPADLAAADLDDDGRDEIAVASGSGVAIADFATTLTLGATGGPAQAAGVAFADVDGDGDDDLLATAGEMVAVRSNDGAGALGAPSSFAAGGAAAGLAPVQVDDDGLADLLVAGERLSLLRSSPGADLVTTVTPDRRYLQPGQVVTFAVLVRNGGGDAARAVELGLSAENGTIGALPDGCAASSCDLGRLDASGERTVSVPVTAGASGVVRLTAAASSLTPDATPANASGTGEATIGAEPTPTPSPSPSPSPTQTATAAPTATATTRPVVTATPTAAAPAPLTISLKAAKTTREAALRKGIPVTVACSSACVPALVAKLGRKVVGSARASLAGAGATKVKVKLSKKGKKAVRKARRPKVTIVAVDRTSGPQPVTATVRVKLG